MLNRILSGLGKALITAGVVLLLFVAYQLWGTGIEQAGHQDDLTGELTEEASPDSSGSESLDEVTASLAEIDPATVGPMEPVGDGEAQGVIEIPRIGMQQVFVQGVSKSDLKKGPGHYPGTPLPGQPGNSAIAGHRTTYGAPFNRIDELQPGDPIYVSTLQGKFRYEVVAPPPGAGIERGPGWFSVLPTQTEVLNPTTDNRLTLTACHPKRSAKQRIIVQAVLATEPAPPAAAAPDLAPGEESAAAEVLTDEDLFGGDPAAKWPAILFGLATLGVWILAGWVAARWKPWATYLLFSPVLAVLLWFCFFYTDHWLPSF